jgi:hypothetical protein
METSKPSTANSALQALILQHAPTQAELEARQEGLARFKERLSKEPSCALKAE